MIMIVKNFRFALFLCMFAVTTLSACSWPTNQSVTATLISDHFTDDGTAKLPLGESANFTLRFSDAEYGVCQARAFLLQGQTTVEVPLTPTTPAGEESPKTIDYAVSLADLTAMGFAEGDATLIADAQNCSLFKGKSHVTKTASVDLTPPRVALTSEQHYLNQAGADVATYTASEDAVWSGVKVGPYEFKGYARPGNAGEAGERFAFFVYPHDLAAGTKIEIVAVDAAGNVGKVTLAPAKFFPKEFRHRDIAIDDEFIGSKVGDIIANTPKLKPSGDPLTDFIAVNRDLRKTNAEFLRDLAAKSEERFFWKDAFRPLANASIEANFADYRSYFYGESKVDEQVHLGFDMAVVERNPITAAGAGKVAFAGYLGIYGNTVVIDHGYGLTSLYAHMSSVNVKTGDPVSRDQVLGKSGATGLAGGDHLHFSMLVQGVQTNPVEFWDQHWIHDHVYRRIDDRVFGQLEE
jgi:murein DD-endopeptidase MepM/ murein hydrolase activator NlpD